MSAQTEIELPYLPPHPWPAFLPRAEVALSKGRKLIVKREGGRFRVAVHRRAAYPHHDRWVWTEGHSTDLAAAVWEAFGQGSHTGETRELVAYLEDVTYRAAAQAMPR